MITEDRILRICTRSPNRSNMLSVVGAYNKYGSQFKLDLPHREVQYLAQILHESGEFRYDREVWGPTPAQQRYDVRTDLGNTPERDGDGFLFRGRTPMQITGRHNTAEYRDWCRENISEDAPDFEQEPDLMNSDPWEGLGPIWYWTTRDLNKYADQGDIEMITKRINGGLNGYEDRLLYYRRVALVYLGYGPDDVVQFQRDHDLDTDGIPGPKTRAAMHVALTRLTPSEARPPVRSGPVTTPETVVPKPLDKPMSQTGGLWERVMTMLGISGAGVAGTVFRDPQVALVFLAFSLLVVGVGLWQWRNILQAVKAFRTELKS